MAIFLLFHFQFDLRMAQYYLMLCTAGLRYAKSVAIVHRQALKFKKQKNSTMTTIVIFYTSSNDNYGTKKQRSVKEFHESN